MTELKPCPFCGGDAMFTVEQRREHPDFGGHSAMCGTCGAGIGYVFACGDDPHPRLREMWNRRATSGVAPCADTSPAPPFDVEAMLRECVPGGGICDPQHVADAIRAYCGRGVEGHWLCRRTGSTRPGPCFPTESGPWEWVPAGVEGGEAGADGVGGNDGR